MKREHTPAETRPARTVFRLSADEAADALAEWVANHGETVPAGSRGIWGRDRAAFADYKYTLVIDHESPDG